MTRWLSVKGIAIGLAFILKVLASGDAQGGGQQEKQRRECLPSPGSWMRTGDIAAATPHPTNTDF